MAEPNYRQSSAKRIRSILAECSAEPFGFSRTLLRAGPLKVPQESLMALWMHQSPSRPISGPLGPHDVPHDSLSPLRTP